MLFKIAWRNIWRNRTRSLVVIASVAVGLFAGMFMMAFFEGLAKQEIDSTVETQLSHIQLHNPRFNDDKEVIYTIANGQAVVANIKKNRDVKAVSGRLITTGMISSSSTASGVEIHGIIPADEKAVSSISKDLIEGAYFSGLKKNEIVIGKKLAEKLEVRLHNKIVLTFQSKTGELTAGSFRIGGIYRSRNSSFDETTVFTTLDDLAPLLGTGDGIHEIALILKDGQRAASVVMVFKKEYPNLLVQTWQELSPEMALLMNLVDQSMYYVIGVILLALMFGIINTMLMAVLERQREFGMLMAIGMNKPRVFFMILFESVMLTCGGIPAGILLTVTSVGYLAKHGIDLSAFSQALSQFGFSNIVYPELEQSSFVPVILMTAFTAVLSAIYPAIKALRFKPAEAIHKI
ncbi:ABC transporter permease [Mucilaginibacter gotjawali]|uniref:Macrolide export ATP-binding/permease protein MacB n=2 Tax=Mucilaginibacter gotjawali TaxID=1550579 RepID=A0A0X8X3Z2_9SPHI|nr:FtsX-like permease family protein [Mucilaginibacter gotjawali]MBB3055536.1 ABC-type lipoprotein release transport system permease subunit [Mucilaginibacter gotjawali]BAU53184.1 Macrolide export ATP-binding/permease protein MacB [Mucilaginibacter gotjawali]